MTMTAPDRALAEPTDAEIVARVVGGARDAFEVLVRRHNQRLFRAARAILRSDEDAEDVLQQTWLVVYRNLAQFRGDAAFTTWATRIAIHNALAAARKRPAIAEVVDAPGDATPQADIERVQLGRLLETTLADLPQAHREVVVLRDVLELDTAETAACLGVTPEAVRVRLHRARAAVAAALSSQLLDEVYAFEGGRCDRMTHAVMAALAREPLPR